MYAVFLLYIESELWPYTSTNLLDSVNDSGSASLVIFNTMKLSVMIVVLSLRTQRLMMALGEYNCWFGYFPCFYHYRVRLHNSLISSCGSSFALHSTRDSRRYTFLFLKDYKNIYFWIIHVQQICQTFDGKALKIVRWCDRLPLISLAYSTEAFLHSSLGEKWTWIIVTGESAVTAMCSLRRMHEGEETGDGNKTFKGNVANITLCLLLGGLWNRIFQIK